MKLILTALAIINLRLCLGNEICNEVWSMDNRVQRIILYNVNLKL